MLNDKQKKFLNKVEDLFIGSEDEDLARLGMEAAELVEADLEEQVRRNFRFEIKRVKNEEVSLDKYRDIIGFISELSYSKDNKKFLSDNFEMVRTIQGVFIDICENEGEEKDA